MHRQVMVDAEEGGSQAGEGGFPVQVQTAPEGRLGDAQQGEHPADADTAIEESERTLQMLARLQAGTWRCCLLIL